MAHIEAAGDDGVTRGLHVAAGAEAVMTNDADWVADVRRWYLSSQRVESAASAAADVGESTEVGYEAAYPALQSPHWPDALPGGASGPE